MANKFLVSPKIHIILFFIVLLFCTASFATPKMINVQLRTIEMIIPNLGIGIPVGNGDEIDLGYFDLTILGSNNRYTTLAYSLQVGSAEGERTAVNFGALFYHYNGGTGGVSPIDQVIPIILYEREWMFNNDSSWLMNFGIPNLVGFGLKYYL